MATEDTDINKKMLVVNTVYILFFMRNTGKCILREHVGEYNGDCLELQRGQVREMKKETKK